MSNNIITPSSSPHNVEEPLPNSQPENPLPQQGHMNQVTVVQNIPQNEVDNEHDGYTTPPVMQRPIAPPNQREIYEAAIRTRVNKNSQNKRKINIIEQEPSDITKKNHRGNPPPPPPASGSIAIS